MLAVVHAAAELAVSCVPTGKGLCWSLGLLLPVVLQSRLRIGCSPLTVCQPQQQHQRQQRSAYEIHGAAAAAAVATAAQSSTAATVHSWRGQPQLLQASPQPPGGAAPPVSTPSARQSSSGSSRRLSKAAAHSLQGRAPPLCFRRRCSGRLRAPSGPQRQAGGGQQKAFPLPKDCC
jgi:hypothetical protein